MKEKTFIRLLKKEGATDIRTDGKAGEATLCKNHVSWEVSDKENVKTLRINGYVAWDVKYLIERATIQYGRVGEITFSARRHGRDIRKLNDGLVVSRNNDALLLDSFSSEGCRLARGVINGDVLGEVFLDWLRDQGVDL